MDHLIKELGPEVSNFIATTGSAVFAMLYFMAKDWKQGQKMIDVMEKSATNLAQINAKLRLED